MNTKLSIVGQLQSCNSMLGGRYGISVICLIRDICRWRVNQEWVLMTWGAAVNCRVMAARQAPLLGNLVAELM